MGHDGGLGWRVCKTTVCSEMFGEWVERMKHCSSPNGLQMAISTSSPTETKDGGISTASEPAHSNRWRLGKLNLGGRNGLLVCRLTRSKAQSGSFAVSLRTANGIWPSLTRAPNALIQSRPDSRMYRNCAPARGRAVFIGGTPTEPPALIDLDLSTGTDRVVRRSAQLNEEVRSCVSTPELITFTTQGGETAHAFFYPPFSHKFTAPQGETDACTRQEPWGADRICIEHSFAGGAVLDQSWHRCARCELPREHGIRSFVPASAEAAMGHFRRSGLYLRGPLSDSESERRP